MTDLVVARIRRAHCKRGPSTCQQCRELDEEHYCLLDVDPEDRGLMQRRTIEDTRGPAPEWREFDVVRSFANEAEAVRFADEHGITVLAVKPDGE